MNAWRRVAVGAGLFVGMAACGSGPVSGSREKASPEASPMLRQSWKAYVAHFIQADGRVIDHSAEGISTSEGQSYAMLRAVWMDDRATFDKTYRWAIDNLNSGVRNDALWAWKWGKNSAGLWRVLDPAFATDADQDAALALILAARRWKEPAYQTAALLMLRDLWQAAARVAGGRLYFLAGDTLCQGRICRLNPSYCAPYAYRVFAAYDNSRPWLQLVDSSYEFLEECSKLTSTGLPPDWVNLNVSTGRLTLGTEQQSRFSYDALRTHWRVAMDYELNGEPRARRYIEHSLRWAANEWKRNGRLPAVISSRGEAKADYEAPEMLAALMAALRHTDPDVATSMRQRLNGMYKDGFWSEPDRYYIQNWAWFGNALYDGRVDVFRE